MTIYLNSFFYSNSTYMKPPYYGQFLVENRNFDGKISS